MSNSNVLPHDTSEEAIIAWRMWRAVVMPVGMTSSDMVYRLRAVTKFIHWEPRVSLTAKCFALISPASNYSDSKVPVYLSGINHQVPNISCKCGIYALRTREVLIKYFADKDISISRPWTVVSSDERRLRPDLIMGCTVFGQVSLWGEIIEGEDGYRAQYAYPYDLTVLADDKRIADSLREQYQVDVRIEKTQAQH